jgi:AcrR family transcriptional regulator
MNKYELRTRKKKTAIINSALKLFGDNGFTSTTIKEIAAEANVSQVSIYNYFNSKQALVRECVNVFMEDILQEAEEIIAEDIDFPEKIKKALSLCTNRINKSLYDYFSTTALNDETLLNLLKENINNKKMKIYRDYIELGKKEGYIDDSISTSTILEFMEALNNVGNKTKPDDIERKQKEIQKLFLHGLIKKR